MRFFDTIARLRLTPSVGIIVGLIVIFVGNAVVFARVMYNRGGEPEIWTFTERELSAPWRFYTDRENSGITLTLNWHGTPPETLEDSGGIWAKRPNIDVDNATLKAFGYPTEYNCNKADDRGNLRLTESAWAALEYDGPTHRQYVEDLEHYLASKESEYSEGSTNLNEAGLKRLRDRVEAVRNAESRLYAVDVAPDRVTLEQRYAASDMHLILPATVMPWLYCERPVGVYITSIVPSHVHVPKQHREVFGTPGRYNRGSEQPQYHAEVAYGKLKEPWLRSITLRDDAGDSPE